LVSGKKSFFKGWVHFWVSFVLLHDFLVVFRGPWPTQVLPAGRWDVLTDHFRVIFGIVQFLPAPPCRRLFHLQIWVSSRLKHKLLLKIRLVKWGLGHSLSHKLLLLVFLYALVGDVFSGVGWAVSLLDRALSILGLWWEVLIRKEGLLNHYLLYLLLVKHLSRLFFLMNWLYFLERWLYFYLACGLWVLIWLFYDNFHPGVVLHGFFVGFKLLNLGFKLLPLSLRHHRHILILFPYYLLQNLPISLDVHALHRDICYRLSLCKVFICSLLDILRAVLCSLALPLFLVNIWIVLNIGLTIGLTVCITPLL
jgi:hypothetical protein